MIQQTTSWYFRAACLFLTPLWLVSCGETDATRRARMLKEAAEANASAERWETVETIALWCVAAAVLAKIVFSIYQHYSKSNISRRLLEQKKDYAAALQVELKAGDYLGIEKIVQGLKLPPELQRSLDLAVGSLSRVGHLFSDKRNTFIPQGLKAEVMESTRQTYHGLFSTIQRVMVLKESHFGIHIDQDQLRKIATDVHGIHLRLERCLREVGSLILQNSTHQDGPSGMEGILAALRDADRMLNTSTLP